MPKQFKIIVEKNRDGYVAYPLGLKGVVVENFGPEVIETVPPALEVFAAEAGVSV